MEAEQPADAMQPNERPLPRLGQPPLAAREAMPSAAETAKLVAVNYSGGTSAAARDSKARNAQSLIAPQPARVAAGAAPRVAAGTALKFAAGAAPKAPIVSTCAARR